MQDPLKHQYSLHINIDGNESQLFQPPSSQEDEIARCGEAAVLPAAPSAGEGGGCNVELRT